MTKSFEIPIQKLALRPKFEPQDPLFAPLDEDYPRTLTWHSKVISHLSS